MSETPASTYRETTSDVAGKSVDRVGSNGLVVVSIVHEDSSKVTNDVDDEEDGTFTRLHSEVASLGIAFDWMQLGSLLEKVIDLAWASESIGGGIGSEGEHQEHDQDDNLFFSSQSNSVL
jgi:hypothetical protein